ncbi:hypothetical protein [Pelagerythrobacter marensis]|uniref:Histidine-specific methyltransferase SAM-dependent domain-containing protein n=1 Tax=Pelagerythrobacter marensis TaxID=543877 RepID=A0A0G3X504_9SPHN|nr:hypothetical protein [Pelagerythrobacter marensis]AKM06257.1 hypothetical protein AM2010_168 [Pelagerythrobacter marensis]
MIIEVFENLLNSLDGEGRERYGDAWVGLVGERLEQLRSDYNELTDPGRTIIDYGDLATQAAYVYAYGVGRAFFTYELLKKHRKELEEPIFSADVARVTSLGGGPGSELAGLVMYLLDESSGESVESIKYWVLDKDSEWEHPCQALIDDLSNHLPIKLIYDELDLANQKECKAISLEGDDLLILSFVISELCALEDKNEILEGLRHLYGTMDSGSYIFYNDSNAYSFYKFFNDSKTFVKGFGRASQVNEVIEEIAFKEELGGTYSSYSCAYDATPHTTSDALSKFLRRV